MRAFQERSHVVEEKIAAVAASSTSGFATLALRSERGPLPSLTKGGEGEG